MSRRNPLPCGTNAGITKDQLSLAQEMLDDIFTVRPAGAIEISGSSIYLRPEGAEKLKAPGVIRSGIYAGEIIKKRIEPAHALFTSGKPETFRRKLELSVNDKETEEYLRGSEIGCEGEKGYTAVMIEGMTVGFGKCSGGRLKNKYPKGLRNK